MKGGRKKTIRGSSSSDTGVHQQQHLDSPYADGMAGEAIDAAAAATEERQQGLEFGKEGEGKERENKEEGEEEKGYDQFGDLEIQEGERDLERGAELRPKLAEGFCEIEALRRERVRRPLYNTVINGYMSPRTIKLSYMIWTNSLGSYR